MFADRLIAVDPRAWPAYVSASTLMPGAYRQLFGGDTPEGLESWGIAVVKAAAGRAGIVKPQAGLFERHGWQGMRALGQCLRRGEGSRICWCFWTPSAAISGRRRKGYAQGVSASDSPFACDALTVNPYMGLDTLEPHVRTAEASGKGVIVLARTSNPGSADYQAKDLEGAPLYARVVESLAPMIERLKGDSGWSGLMLVTGATGPERSASSSGTLAPDALFLVPGYGAQGAGASSRRWPDLYRRRMAATDRKGAASTPRALVTFPSGVRGRPE